MLLDKPVKKHLESLKSYYWDRKTQNLFLEKGFMPRKAATDLEIIQEDGKSKAKAYTVNDLTYLYAENMAHIYGIVDIARKKKAKVIFLTIPCYITYLDNIAPKQLDLIHQTMNGITNNNDIFYYDMLEDARKYDLKDFGDGDHLSYHGAKKVTMKLDSIIKTIEK